MNTAITKESLIHWWLLAFIALFLWYRNNYYDRIFAVYFFVVALSWLIQYGFLSGASDQQSGNSIYIILWLQCMVLAIGVFTYLRNHQPTLMDPHQRTATYLSGINLFVYAVITLIAILYIVFGQTRHVLEVNGGGVGGGVGGGGVGLGGEGGISWTTNGTDTILGPWYVNVIYILGIMIPLILLFVWYEFKDFGLLLLMVYILLSIMLALWQSSPQFLPALNYYMIGFAFVTFMIGIDFSGISNSDNHFSEPRK